MFNLSPWPLGRALTAVAAIIAFPVHAQTADEADERAVERAADAFGIRIGVEQIGLYNETQVRGFNLQDAGNYRIDDVYFAKSGGLIDTKRATCSPSPSPTGASPWAPIRLGSPPTAPGSA